VKRPAADWRRPFGRPRTSWLRTVIDGDLQSLNFGSTRFGGRQQIRTFGIESSVRVCSTEEFATKEEVKREHEKGEKVENDGNDEKAS